jgi:hypothetical protein
MSFLQTFHKNQIPPTATRVAKEDRRFRRSSAAMRMSSARWKVRATAPTLPASKRVRTHTHTHTHCDYTHAVHVPTTNPFSLSRGLLVGVAVVCQSIQQDLLQSYGIAVRVTDVIRQQRCHCCWTIRYSFAVNRYTPPSAELSHKISHKQTAVE